ncbi:hypothetical protein L596_023616 [Steinernema carpocapsae]|uniref:Uncharacterized protein n=1 Tax=Steinernema carpocapsae TaxID=34508 RepID=A0A4U5ME60_STECR|nr:hypothetical protein L596_023616 [Steinernema carpocapsae]
MMEDFGVTVVVPLVLAAISYFAYRVYTSGLFDEPKVSVVESVPHLAKPLVVYYKYHIGGYGKVKNLFEEASSLVPKDAKTFYSRLCRYEGVCVLVYV